MGQAGGAAAKSGKDLLDPNATLCTAKLEIFRSPSKTDVHSKSPHMCEN